MNYNIENIRKELESHSEEKYQKFMMKLVPGVDNLIGVRIPTIRKIAKRIAKEDPQSYLENAEEVYFEEAMLQGLVITQIKDIELTLERTKVFIPKITNWSVCDSFCAGLKIAKNNQDLMWNFIMGYVDSDHAYDVRFAIVMMNFHFVNERYIQEAFKCFDKVSHTDYYVKMAVAWAVSTYFVKYPDQIMVYLKNNNLDDWTYNKALQKIRESLKVDKEMKALIKTMKR